MCVRVKTKKNKIERRQKKEYHFPIYLYIFLKACFSFLPQRPSYARLRDDTNKKITYNNTRKGYIPSQQGE